MKSAILLFTAFLFFQSRSTGQNSYSSFQPAVAKLVPTEKTILYQMGQTLVPIKVLQYGNKADLVFVNMHDNEFTSVNGTKPILETRGGLLIRIENRKQRNIKFKLAGRTYTVDPNRIFSKEGAAVSLRENGPTNDRAAEEANRLGQRILDLIPDTARCVFALHNNFDKDFSIAWYGPGGKRESDGRKLYIDSLEDPDDLILTTDSLLFEQIAARRYNVVFQDIVNVRKDGSLSVYYGEKGRKYINLETQHGKTKKYSEMMGFLCSLFDAEEIQNTRDEIIYTCLLPAGFVPADKMPVRFGQKEIGWLVPAGFNSETGQYNGKLYIRKEQALFSNADLFVMNSGTEAAYLDIRIDPTRERNQLQPGAFIPAKAGQ